MKKLVSTLSIALALIMLISTVAFASDADFGDLPLEVYGAKLADLDAGGTLHGQYAGEKIVVVTKQGENEDGLKAVAKYFEVASGAEVEVVAYPESNYNDKVQLDLSSGHTYDVICMPIAFIHSFAESGYVQELTPYFENSNLANPLYDMEDFIPSLLEGHGMYRGTLYAVPYKPDVEMLFYRTDLFENPEIQEQFKEKTGKDLKVPETFDELCETAAFFTKSLNPDSPIDYGFNLMGGLNLSRWTFYNRLAGLGGSDLDANFRPAFNNEIGVEAMKQYLKLAEYCTPEWVQFDYDATNNFFTQGYCAMCEQWPSLGMMSEAEGSKVQGKVGYAVIPDASPCRGGWSIALPEGIKNNELAFKFIEYATSKDMSLVSKQYVIDPCRASVYEIPGVSEENPAFVKALADSLAVGSILADYDVPYISSRLNDITEVGMNAMILGTATIEDTLASMEEQIIAEIDAIGLYE